MFTIRAEGERSSASRRNWVVFAGPTTLMRMFSLRSSLLIEREFWSGTELTPALLIRKSTLAPSRALAAEVTKERMESWEPVSQVRIWVEGEATDLRSVRSTEEERTVARMVLSSDWESWRMNSRPRPRLAPGFCVSVLREALGWYCDLCGAYR